MNRVPQDFIDAMKRISGGQPDMAANTQAAQKGTGNLCMHARTSTNTHTRPHRGALSLFSSTLKRPLSLRRR